MSEEHAPSLEEPPATRVIANVEEYFELESCRAWCDDNNYHNVALQFPDHLLAYSPTVYNALTTSTTHFHILADTNYGACCVDEVAAQRLSTQAIIHFGHSCNSKVLSLPTLFIFGKEPVDLDNLVQSFKQTFTQTDRVLVVFDSVYYHSRSHFISAVRCYPNVTIRKYSREQNTANSGDDTTVDMSGNEEYAIFYVGTESLALTNCILSNGSRKVWSYDPSSKECRLESKSVNKMLIKRFSNIEKIKRCKIIGILIGTLGIKNFREVIDRMKRVIKAADKKFYIVSIGKPNPPKLANFAEIGAFVMVGCPENSLLDCTEFYQPIVTPYELEIACVDRPWEIDYISDCSSLLDVKYIDIPSHDTNSDGMNDKAIEKFKSLDIAVNYLNDRTWSGLQQRLGEDEPAVLKQGQFGIAGFYEDEPEGDTRVKS